MVNKRFSKGFGIVEVVISSTIIIIILGALIFMARSIIGNAEASAVRFQGAQIAQFQIEKLRQIRDTNYIDGNPNTRWSSFLSDATDSPDAAKYYKIEADDSQILEEVGNADKPETFDAQKYNNRRYYGRLQIQKIESAIGGIVQGIGLSDIPAYKVTSEVFWFENAESTLAPDLNDMKKVTVVEVITDNRPVY